MKSGSAHCKFAVAIKSLLREKFRIFGLGFTNPKVLG